MALLLDFLTLFVSSVVAVSNCPISLTPSKSIRPSVAAGYEVALVATGLTKPRSIAFDTLGNLLVVQQDVGIINLVFQDDGGTCLSVQSQREVISSSEASCTKLCQLCLTDKKFS